MNYLYGVELVLDLHDCDPKVIRSRKRLREYVDQLCKILDMKKFGSDGLSALFPLWLLKYLPNMPACHISIFFNLQGPNNTLTTGASAGLQAVCEAFRIIQRGSADLMLAGGAESKLNPLGLSHYKILGLLPGDSENPQEICRPFDDKTRGLVIGEGAGFLLLEEYEHAKKRGAAIYAEITGYGLSFSKGQKSAMKIALKQSQIAPKDIDYLQAAGLGIAGEDRKEAEAIDDVFSPAGDLCVAVSKPAIGFTGFSAGPLDLILCAQAVKKGEIPPVLNANGTACRYGFRLVKDHPAKKNIRHALTNAFGLGGECVSVALKSVC